MWSAPGIKVEDARLRFGDLTVFDGLDLSIGAARWTCLLGPSGVGKTSLLRLVAGLPAQGGETSGRVSASDGQPLTDRIAFMAQSDLLMPWASVLDNVLIGPKLRGDLARNRAEHVSRAEAMLDRVGLSERMHAMPAELSGGMRQRTALARTLAEDRPVVLMDEPFSALDAISRYRLQDMAAELLEGRTVLLITHDPMEALRLGHRIEVLSGTPAQLATPALEPAGDPPRPTDQVDIAAYHSDLLERLAGAGSAAREMVE